MATTVANDGNDMVNADVLISSLHFTVRTLPAWRCICSHSFIHDDRIEYRKRKCKNEKVKRAKKKIDSEWEVSVGRVCIGATDKSRCDATNDKCATAESIESVWLGRSLCETTREILKSSTDREMVCFSSCCFSCLLLSCRSAAVAERLKSEHKRWKTFPPKRKKHLLLLVDGMAVANGKSTRVHRMDFESVSKWKHIAHTITRYRNHYANLSLYSINKIEYSKQTFEPIEHTFGGFGSSTVRRVCVEVNEWVCQVWTVVSLRTQTHIASSSIASRPLTDTSICFIDRINK